MRRWAEEDELREYKQRKKQSREREKQPPPVGVKLRHMLSGHADSVRSVAWSSNGKQLVSGSDDKSIKLWDIQIGQALHTFSGHTDSVLSVAWSPDGKTMVSGSADNTIKLWDIQTEQVLHTFSGHTNSVISEDSYTHLKQKKTP